MRLSLYLTMLCFAVDVTASAEETSATTVYEKSFACHGELSLRLDVDAADIRLNQNNADECKVFIEYNERYCDVRVNYDKKNHELNVSVDHDNIDIIAEQKSNTSEYAVIRIDLPYRSEIDIDAGVKAGKLEMQLGDLQVRNLVLSGWAGEALIDFAKPNRREINRLDIDFKFGSLEILNLGNARFKEADITSVIGELTVDFSGAKMDRSLACIDLEIGRAVVIVPKDIAIKMKISKILFVSGFDCPRWFDKKGSYYYSRNYDQADQSLFLSIRTGIGEAKIITKP